MICIFLKIEKSQRPTLWQQLFDAHADKLQKIVDKEESAEYYGDFAVTEGGKLSYQYLDKQDQYRGIILEDLIIDVMLSTQYQKFDLFIKTLNTKIVITDYTIEFCKEADSPMTGKFLIKE